MTAATVSTVDVREEEDMVDGEVEVCALALATYKPIRHLTCRAALRAFLRALLGSFPAAVPLHAPR